jgi:hypothetical protein
VWYDILKEINKVNKLVQEGEVHLDVEVALIGSTTAATERYSVSGFANAKKEAKELAVSLDSSIEFDEHRR